MASSIKSRLRSAHNSGAEEDATDFECGKYATLPDGFSRLPPDMGQAPDLPATGGLLRKELDADHTLGASSEFLAETAGARTEMHADPDEGVVSSTEEDEPEDCTMVWAARQQDDGPVIKVDLQEGGAPTDNPSVAQADARQPAIRPKTLTPIHQSEDGRGSGNPSSGANAVQRGERYVYDEEGYWVTFNVPSQHHLYGRFFPIEKENIPEGFPISHAREQAPYRNLTGGAKLTSAVPKTTDNVRVESTPTSMVRPPKAATMRPEVDMQYFETELADIKRMVRRTCSDRHKLTRGSRNRTDTELDSAYDTVGETHPQRWGCKTTRDVYTTDYETCRETELERPYKTGDGRRLKVSRRRRARTPSDRCSDAPSVGTDEQSVMDMIQRCLKPTLEAIVEEKMKQSSTSAPAVEKLPSAGGQEPQQGGGQPPDRNDATSPAEGNQPVKLEISDVRSLAPTCPMYGMTVAPHPGMPLSAITKFDGQYWEEFIEYFESVADANMWTEKDRLTYLLMSIEGKARSYAKSEKGIPQTYANVKARLHSRYSQHEPAFSVRNQLRDIRRTGGERLEDFADRLQEVAQRGNLDAWERDELFYQAFIQAVKGTPKMQVHLEKQYRTRRATGKDTKLSDLLAWVREYREKSPASAVQTAALMVCKPVTQRKVKLTHDDGAVAEEVAEEQDKVHDEKEERKRTKNATNSKDLTYALNELEWVKKVIKENKLHHKKGKGKKPYGQNHDGGKTDNKSGAKVNTHGTTSEDTQGGCDGDGQE